VASAGQVGAELLHAANLPVEGALGEILEPRLDPVDQPSEQSVVRRVPDFEARFEFGERANHRLDVAQAASLPYRRLPTCGLWTARGRFEGLPTGSRRHSRLAACATGVGG
jgi:hypothetical protein